MRKINEIFYSLQGEGAHTGVPCVFVRFSGCNKRCSFCDTLHDTFKPMSDDEICAEINRYDAKWIVLTGGEPAMWIDGEFINKLHHSTGKRVAIETNGSLPLPEGIDWVTVSPKSGMPGAGNYDIKAAHADEIKVVDLGQDLDQYLSLGCRDKETVMCLQPCFTADSEATAENMRKTVERVLENPEWRLSVQMHRFLGIR